MIRRIVLSTFGSLGDLHPFIALGLGLRERGHEAVFATGEYYRPKIEGLGFELRALRPNVSPDDREMVALLMDIKKGSERVLRGMMFPNLRDTYADLRAAAEGADFLLAGELVYAAPILGEKTGLPWASVTLSPLSFLSAWDPPVLPPHPGLAKLRRLGPRVNRAVMGFGRLATRSWIKPVQELRRDLGLPLGEHPIFEGKLSPHLGLALFSRVIGEPQPDWPSNTVITGFATYDAKRENLGTSAPELERFLDQGEPPIVFTLGSAAVLDPGEFYQESAKAARELGRRAVLLMGWNPLPTDLPKEIFATDYAPYSDVFPRAAAIVHQGGIGTTAQGLRAGRPTLVMPYSHDQPDNAARLERLGTSRTIPRNRYTAARAVTELCELLGNPKYAVRAEEIGRIVQAEDGVTAACDAIEARLIGAPRLSENSPP